MSSIIVRSATLSSVTYRMTKILPGGLGTGRSVEQLEALRQAWWADRSSWGAGRSAPVHRWSEQAPPEYHDKAVIRTQSGDKVTDAVGMHMRRTLLLPVHTTANSACTSFSEGTKNPSMGNELPAVTTETSRLGTCAGRCYAYLDGRHGAVHVSRPHRAGDQGYALVHHLVHGKVCLCQVLHMWELR